MTGNRRRWSTWSTTTNYMMCTVCTSKQKKIETHIVEAGSTLDAFMRDARRTLESAEEFDSSRFFLEALLATTTYETFLGLMMTEARRVKDKRDAKLDTIDEDEEKSGHK